MSKYIHIKSLMWWLIHAQLQYRFIFFVSRIMICEPPIATLYPKDTLSAYFTQGCHKTCYRSHLLESCHCVDTNIAGQGSVPYCSYLNKTQSKSYRYHIIGPGVGITKAPFVNFSVSNIFHLVKVPLRLFKSHLYLTGATTAELRRHLSNINMIFNS